MDYIKNGLEGLSIGLKQAEKAIDLSIEAVNKTMGELMTNADPAQQKRIMSQQKQINSFIKQVKEGKDINKVINATIDNIQKQLKDLEDASQNNR